MHGAYSVKRKAILNFIDILSDSPKPILIESETE
jgi:hypothetical protein